MPLETFDEGIEQLIGRILASFSLLRREHVLARSDWTDDRSTGGSRGQGRVRISRVECAWARHSRSLARGDRKVPVDDVEALRT